jgi:hypothetical protein
MNDGQKSANKNDDDTAAESWKRRIGNLLMV